VGAYLEPALSKPTMNPTITTQDYPEPCDLTSTSFCPRTNSQPMGRPASPTDSVSSTPTLCGSSSPTLCHSQNGSDASSTSLQAGLSKLKSSCVESIHPSTMDPISVIETNLDQAFSRMLVSSCMMSRVSLVTDSNNKGHFHRGTESVWQV